MSKSNRFLILVTILFFVLYNLGAETSTSIDWDRLRNEIKPLDLSKPPEPTALEQEYFRYFKMDFADVDHYWGAIYSHGETLATHVYQPPDYKATVMVLHGYLDHSAYMREIIAALLAEKYCVVAYDLPGHGLSTGPQADIDGFDHYFETCADFASFCYSSFNGPFFFIGHSTGCAVGLDFLMTKKPPLRGTVMLAPLVRSAWYGWSKVGRWVFKLFSDDVRRIFVKASHNPDFNQFQNYDDPLGSRRVPLRWAGSLFEWNKEKIPGYPKCNADTLLVQGTKDGVVAWRYNVSYYQENFNRLTLTYIDGAKHHLLNEIEEYKNETIAVIIDYIKNRLAPAN